jgi:dUTPase
LLANAKIPTKLSEGAAGLDLYAAHDLIIKPNDKAILDIRMRRILIHGQKAELNIRPN